MAYADVTPDDIAARWRPLEDTERAVAAVLLADAVAMLDLRRPLLAAQVADGLVPERIVTALLCDAVQRVLRNPDVMNTVNVSSDGSVGQSFLTSNAPALRVQITDADLSVLDVVPAAVAGSGAYMVPLL